MTSTASSFAQTWCGVLLPAALFSGGLLAADDPPAVSLERNTPVRGEVSGAAVHRYGLSLAAGECADLLVDRRGIDVVLKVQDSASKPSFEVDSDVRLQGKESFTVVAGSTAVYRLTVSARYPQSPPVGYEIRVIDVRRATARDISLDEARRILFESVEARRTGKYDQALEAGKHALEIREKVLSPDDPAVASTLANVGEAYLLKRVFATAESLQQRALGIRERVFGPEDSTVATSLTLLSEVYRQTGNFGKAESMLRRALQIHEKLFGPEHPAVGTTLNNLGGVYFSMGLMSKAQPLFERSLEIREKALGSDHQDLAPVLNNLGLVERGQGNYDRAEILLRRAFNVWEKAMPPDHPQLGMVLFNLALVIRQRGDRDSAEQMYRRALAIFEKGLGPDHPSVARTLNRLANLSMARGELDQAEQLETRALRISEKALGPKNTQVAQSYESLASIRQERGDLIGAEEHLRHALEIWRNSSPDHPGSGGAFTTLARIRQSRGDYMEAEELLQHALRIAEKGFGPQHPDVSLALSHLFVVYLARGDYSQALAAQSRANAIIERNLVYSLATGSEQQKLTFLSHISEITDRIITLSVRLDPKNPAAAELAATTVLERKGRVLDALTDSLQSLRRHLAPADQKLLDEFKQVSSQLAGLALRGPEGPAPQASRIQALEEEHQRLEAEIARRSAGYFADSKPPTLEQVRAVLPGNAALVEFIRFRPFDPKAPDDRKAYGEPRYAAYVVRSTGPVQWADLGAAGDIDSRVDALRQALREPQRNDARRLARQLDEVLLQPLRAWAGDARHLMISPDGELNLIPFEALVEEQGGYLVERYSLTYLTSGRDLMRVQVPRVSQSPPLVMAAPSFGESDPANPVGIAHRESPRRSTTSAPDLASVYFAPLVGAREEARGIQSLFPDATLLTGIQATKDALQKVAAPRILHIATHGFFLEDAGAARAEGSSAHPESPWLRAGLAFAGANRIRGGDHSGILTAIEASNLNLWGTQVVVLSACETGVGEVKIGEGVFGLRRAFFLAGAETLVMSLWPVSDHATREIMTSYYSGLKDGLGRAEALRQAQLTILKRKDRQHPFYWAGFIQSGDWRVLNAK